MNKAFLLGCGCLGIIILALVVFGGAIAAGYNSLVQSSTTVDASWAQVQTQYQRRADLIPNLVRTVEGAANFEKSTLTDVVNARANATKVTIDPSKAPTDPEKLRQFEQAQNALPLPFLVVLLFWLSMLHLSFGLFAPRNATVITVLLISALSVSGAIFIILEMNHPLQGTIKVSSAPMRKALEHLGQ